MVKRKYKTINYININLVYSNIACIFVSGYHSLSHVLIFINPIASFIIIFLSNHVNGLYFPRYLYLLIISIFSNHILCSEVLIVGLINYYWH